MKCFSKAALTGLAATLAMALPAGGQAAEFQLTASSSHPPVVPWVLNLKEFVVPEATKRAEALGHKIIWTEAYAGALYNYENTLAGIGQGLGDIGWVGSLWEPNTQPLMNVTFAAPFITGEVQAASDIQKELTASIPALAEEWTRHNTVFLGPQGLDEYVIASTFPINGIEDLDGRKLYAVGMTPRWIENSGAVGVAGGLPIYYNGIQTGVADGVILPFSSILPFKLHEVAPYITFVGFGGGFTGGLAMNKDTYDSLPEELQKMFHEIGNEYGDKVVEGILHNFNTHQEKLKADGAKISELSLEAKKKWSTTIPNLAAEWVKNNEAAGLPAREVLVKYLEGVRARGIEPVRNWDEDLD